MAHTITDLESRTGTTAAALGSSSLSWRYFGLWAGFAGGSVPQLLQLMHPVLGHAVAEHSNVRDDPFDRLIRSMGPIYGVVYDGPDARSTAETVRRYHETIKGTMPDGTRYSGLHPDVYFWAHATFAHGLIYGFSDLLGPFTRAQQEQLYAETCQWYELYGMTMRNVPATLDEFDQYFEQQITEVLELTESADWLLQTLRRPPQPPGLEWIPNPLWQPYGRAIGFLAVAYAARALPSVTRERLGLSQNLPWRIAGLFAERLVRQVTNLTPRQWRYHPRAYAGWKRDAQQAGMSVRQLIGRK